MFNNNLQHHYILKHKYTVLSKQKLCEIGQNEIQTTAALLYLALDQLFEEVFECHCKT